MLAIPSRLRPDTVGTVIFIVGSVATVVGAVIAFSLAASQTRQTRRTVVDAASQKTLEDRLEELSRSMRNSARLVRQVSAELDARAVTAKKLREEAETAEALAGIHKEEVEAIRRLMDTELEGTARRIRRDSIWIGIASFAAGSGVTFVVTLFVPPLH